MMMDFEGSSWDVGAEAENLSQSLFGKVFHHDSESLRKGKKRKHRTTLDNGINKKVVSDKHNVISIHNNKKLKQKNKRETAKLAIEMSENEGNGYKTETSQGKKKKDHKGVFKKNLQTSHLYESFDSSNKKDTVVSTDLQGSFDDLSRKNSKGSAEYFTNFDDNTVKKKKRKRKCKKNKFKDYSKPDSFGNGEDDFVNNEGTHLCPGSKGSSIKNNHVCTVKTNAEYAGLSRIPENAFRQQKKKRKTHRDLDLNPDINRNEKNVSSTKDPEFSSQQKNKEDILQNEFMVIEEPKINSSYRSSDSDLSKSKNTLKITKRHKLKESACNGNLLRISENASKKEEKETFEKKDFAKHKRNTLDPKKLQTILIDNAQMKTKFENFSDTKTKHDKLLKSKTDINATPGSLLERSRQRLNAARFRYLNEQLYTTTGSEAFQMFMYDKEAFQVYHDGFQGQVEKWPINPVDIIIDYIKAKPKDLLVADFGCGDAKIGQNVPNKVHSFDLVALNHNVTVCDMSKVPLKDSSIDIAVFCLSLMGTNLSSYLLEANRVLKKNGILKIAEVTSRFHTIGKFVLEVKKMGFKILHQDTSNKMFILMDFKKTGPPKSPTAEIKLDPCVYKKR